MKKHCKILNLINKNLLNFKEIQNLINFEKLHPDLKNEQVKIFYDKLKTKKFNLILKRLFDILASLCLIILLSPLMLIIFIFVKLTSKGPAFYFQERVTKNKKIFKIIKFRTMVVNADKIGTLVTLEDDPRITKIGKILRKFRLDEFPQLFNILSGNMSFVGTRPEVLKYVELYTDKMKATLLLPAGVTSLASIKFKDEDKLLNDKENTESTEKIYIEKILPEKMKYNLEYLDNFNLWFDIKIMLKTFFAVIK